MLLVVDVSLKHVAAVQAPVLEIDEGLLLEDKLMFGGS